MNSFDLQIQTTASDGKHAPAECIKMAKENGVSTIAITDHDTVAGISEAMEAGKKLGVRVIPGIEISIQEHGMHLLGLGIDKNNPQLLAAMGEAAQNRIAAARQMVENFKKDGFFVEWEDVLAEAGRSAVISRPHIVQAILKRPENKEKLQGISTKQEFFERCFTDKSPYYVRASALTPESAIKIVHAAGGLAVWSHPVVPDFVGDCDGAGEFLKKLVSFGLDGLELLSPAHTEADVVCLERLAQKYNLLVTAGSDFHEAYDPQGRPWPRSASTIGEYPVYGRSTAGILEALDKAVSRML